MSAPLCAPQAVINLARAAMGSIDFDPTATPLLNRTIGAARIFDPQTTLVEQVLQRPWTSSDGTPVNALLSLYGSGDHCRRLLKKTLREHQLGHLKSAVIWLGHTETATKCPWIWDHLVVIPFRRLRPLYYDEELEQACPTSPSAWSLVIAIPPASPTSQWMFTNRFYQQALPMGRVVLSEAGKDWMAGWRDCTGKTYDERS